MFFIVLAYVSLFSPTKEENGWIDPNLQGRNWVFFMGGGAGEKESSC